MQGLVEVEIDRILLRALYETIGRTKGRCLLIKPKKLLKRAGLSTKPVDCALANYFLKKLADRGLIEVWRETSHGIWYIIYDSSPLWKEAKKLFQY